MESHEELGRRVRALEVALERRRRHLRVGAWSSAAALVVAVCGVSARAWSQGCGDALPVPLHTFCAGQPAVAAQVNDNFRQLFDWIEGKLGDPRSGRVWIQSQDEAGPNDDGGSLVIGAAQGKNLALDDDAVLARSAGLGSTLSIEPGAGAGDTVLNEQSGRVGIGVGAPADRLHVRGGVVSQGDIRNLNPDGQLGISSSFAFRDTGDRWLRLRSGPGSGSYADLAVRELYTQQKLIQMLRVDMGNETTASTGVSDAEWDCWLGGLDFPDGDVQERGSGSIMFAYTYIDSGVWHVAGDFRSHRNHESHSMRVVCARDTVVQRESW